MKNKKIMAFVLSFCAMFFLTAASNIDIIREDGKSNIITERIDYNEFYYIDVKLYENYNQVIFTVVNHTIMEYDEGIMEKVFYETIENWTRDEKHRYFKYIITSRKFYYSRKVNGNKTFQYEIKLNLKK